jgi:hypothetical protein
MRIGNLHLTWVTDKKLQAINEAIIGFLTDHPAAREAVARMARSEVKNYLAEVAEQAQVPFDDPVSCLRNVWNLYQYGKSPAAQARAKETYALVSHGPDCPGHTTGLPAPECMGKEPAK